MKLLVGDTGLVGTSLKEQTTFDHTFNSKNIEELKNIARDGDEIYLTCLPATKWLVNKDIEQDIKNIYYIIEQLKDIKYSNIILISTN